MQWNATGMLRYVDRSGMHRFGGTQKNGYTIESVLESMVIE
jgi:hypothetical protein